MIKGRFVRHFFEKNDMSCHMIMFQDNNHETNNTIMGSFKNKDNKSHCDLADHQSPLLYNGHRVNAIC